MRERACVPCSPNRRWRRPSRDSRKACRTTFGASGREASRRAPQRSGMHFACSRSGRLPLLPVLQVLLVFLYGLEQRTASPHTPHPRVLQPRHRRGVYALAPVAFRPGSLQRLRDRVFRAYHRMRVLRGLLAVLVFGLCTSKPPVRNRSQGGRRTAHCDRRRIRTSGKAFLAFLFFKLP